MHKVKQKIPGELNYTQRQETSSREDTGEHWGGLDL